ncbi:hypothetical protein NLS1_28280 [Nocardioides sp. LS1]|nr:hypothetical protein NLS1_28280 [Nocardioides sp. LS1]
MHGAVGAGDAQEQGVAEPLACGAHGTQPRGSHTAILTDGAKDRVPGEPVRVIDRGGRPRTCWSC